MYRFFGKLLFDRLLSVAAILMLSPILMIAGLFIFLEDGGPIFFRQRRVGAEGQIFCILKFRSMPVNTEIQTSAEGGNLKITRVGRIIRRLNIDELPQLFNVVMGEMSLIGPRPSLPSQDKLHDRRRENGAMSLRPGISGMAQIKAFDGMTEAQKAEWDGWYAARMSLALDLSIIMKTFLYLLKPPPTY